MDDVDGPPPPYSGLTAGRNNATKNPSPAFDDSIYSVPQSECEWRSACVLYMYMYTDT